MIQDVTDCTFELAGEVDLEHADRGSVLLDGEPLGYQDPDGWRMRDSRVLELLGSACERARTDSRELAISFPCDQVTLL